MKTVFSRMVTLILTILMIFYVFPYETISAQVITAHSEDIPAEQKREAAEETDGSSDSESENEEESLYVLHEEKNLREEKSKHYRMSNGSIAAVSFPKKVHYLNEEGSYEEIDNTLTGSTEGYQNSSNEVEYSFSDDPEACELVSVSYGEYSLSVGITEDEEEIASEELITDNSAAELESELTEGEIISSSETEKSIEIINPGSNYRSEIPGDASVYSVTDSTESSDGEKLSLEDAVSNVKNESSIKYVNISEGIDLRYDLLGNSLKEYIILKEIPERNIFSFDIGTEALMPVLNEDKSISLSNEDGEEIFTIPAPYMIDALGNISYECEYILSESEKGFGLGVEVSREWLEEEGREYPVMIDPALIVDEDDSITTGYYGESSNNTNLSSGNIYMGRDSSADGIYRTYLKVNSLPSLPYSTIPTKATVMLAQKAFDDGGGSMEELTVSARIATGTAWQTSYDSNVLDYTVLSADTTDKFISWDVSKAAKGWYKYEKNSSAEDAIANNGIVFISEESFETGGAKATLYGFHSINFASNAEPKFVVYYRNIIGVEDYYSYHSQDIGGSGNRICKSL